jgi:Tfp pilus assembly protein PilF
MIYLKEKPAAIILSLLLILSSCSKHASEDTEYSSAKLVSFLNSSEIAQSSLLSEHEKKGLNHLLEDDLAQASLEFNRALASKPKDPLPHFLNALTYHLISKQGDVKKAELAEIGYTLAIKRDPSHAYSYYYRGILMLEKKKYQEAQNDFASAVLNKPNQPKFFHGLAVSSYYARDITTAAGAIDKALSLDPENPEFLHTAAIIMAAGGEFKKAATYQKKLKGFEKHQRKANFVANRIGDWQSFHKHLKLASEESTGLASGGFKALKEEIKNPESTDEKSTEKPLDQIDDRMVIVDVVLILTQEENTDTYGLNLLENLKLNYKFDRKFGRTTNTKVSYSATDTNNGFSTDGTKNSFQYFLHSVTIPAVSYSINAATAQGTRSEILARPSLLARHNKSSHFFSGDNILFGFGTNNNIDFKEKEVGIFLVVTPHILDDGRVNIKLDVKRSFFVPQNPNVTASSITGFQTSTTRLISDVVLEAGDTLVLGGTE